MNKTIKFLSLPTAILALLSATIAPLASYPVEKWSLDYTCGQYDITVSEKSHGVLNYQSRSARGNLNLKGGTIQYIGTQKLFKFHNGDYKYWLWTNLDDRGGVLEVRAGVLEVYHNQRKLLKQDCLLFSATPISPNSKYLPYPMSGIVRDSFSKDSRQGTSVFPIEIGTIDRSEPRLIGCGTNLWQIETNPNQDGFLFSHKDEDPLMVFNDKIINLKKAIVSSQVDEENYGTFTTEDGSISVQVDFTMGELIGYESRSISKGTITITTQGQTKDIDVVGVWGC